MNAYTDNDNPHAAVAPLLPWHAAGQLEEPAATQVREHLATCAACRADLAWERQLRAAAGRAAPPPVCADADAALARLLPRLEPAPASLLASLVAWLSRPPVVPAALAATIAALCLALSLDRPPDYHALGPLAPPADATVMFRPDTGAAEVRRILAATGAGTVHGPTVAGAYVLRLGPERRAAALARLRAEPAVLLAEPLGAGVPP
ncbi:putative zinc finger protein [Pseudoduganella lurida]|uniref:Putative zinc finger protein n=1 Tax=Pseudoduganella lurida TaxID=1036180 RepID=A0A562RGD5_9BURK|nr:zf-HC2 domain-containing protein [Pseudoduganella lurida]TWI67476.1 putative zinc finger protein [Pseudoduganella lurida]